MTKIDQTLHPLTHEEIRLVGGGADPTRSNFSFGIEREMKESDAALPGLHKSSDVTLKRGLIG